jgi:hypothetical protein
MPRVSNEASARGRELLDSHFDEWRSLRGLARPPHGLDTLQRAADALGWDLVYLLVPRRPLTATVRDRARQLARWQIAAVEQTMRLEDQAPGAIPEMEERLTAQLLERGHLWDRDPHE